MQPDLHHAPGGKGVISNFLKADHPRHGALLGKYHTLTDSLPQLTHLLPGICPDLASWKRWAS